MNILLANFQMKSWTGSELFVRDLALALHARGHSIIVFAPVCGCGGAAQGEDAVLYGIGLHPLAISQILLVQPPRIGDRVLRHDVLRSLDIAAREIEDVVFLQRVVVAKHE